MQPQCQCLVERAVQRLRLAAGDGSSRVNGTSKKVDGWMQEQRGSQDVECGQAPGMVGRLGAG